MRQLILCSVVVALLVGLILALTLTGTGQTNTRFIVTVSVSCDNEALKAELESYLKRELRGLGDVEISDFPIGWHDLSVIAIEGTNKSGTKTGDVYFSCLGEKRFDALSLKSYVRESVFADAIDILAGLAYWYPRFHRLEVGVPRAEIKQFCQMIVANFDTKLLEPERQKR